MQNVEFVSKARRPQQHGRIYQNKLILQLPLVQVSSYDNMELGILLFSVITGVSAASPEACRNLPRATWENHLAGRERLRDKAASRTGWLTLGDDTGTN